MNFKMSPKNSFAPPHLTSVSSPCFVDSGLQQRWHFSQVQQKLFLMCNLLERTPRGTSINLIIISNIKYSWLLNPPNFFITSSWHIKHFQHNLLSLKLNFSGISHIVGKQHIIALFGFCLFCFFTTIKSLTISI